MLSHLKGHDLMRATSFRIRIALFQRWRLVCANMRLLPHVDFDLDLDVDLDCLARCELSQACSGKCVEHSNIRIQVQVQVEVQIHVGKRLKSAHMGLSPGL